MEHVSELAVTPKQPEIPGQSISKVHLLVPWLIQKNANTVSLRRQGVVISAMPLDMYTAQLRCTAGDLSSTVPDYVFIEVVASTGSTQHSALSNLKCNMEVKRYCLQRRTVNQDCHVCWFGFFMSRGGYGIFYSL